MLGLHAVQDVARETLSELSVAYPQSPLNGPIAAAKEPEARPSPAASAVEPIGALPRFAIFLPTRLPDLVPNSPACWKKATARRSIRAASVSCVRDGYVAMTAKAGDWNAVRGYLYNLRRIGTG